jgi:hypothetical protein
MFRERSRRAQGAPLELLSRLRVPRFRGNASAGDHDMASSSEFTNVPGMTKEMRESVSSAFDALSNWRDEIETANERCLDKVLDKTSAVARSMGWPDQAVRATREYLKTTSKAQTEVIDQIMETWKRQLKSPTAPLAIPRGFAGQMPGVPAGSFPTAMPQFNPMAPWAFWMQAAQAWQRAWMPEGDPRDRSH